MSAPADRRGFLRGLVTLPLIGGGVTLIGAPTAVAAPITPILLRQYVGFLGREFGDAHDELLRLDATAIKAGEMLTLTRQFIGDAYLFHKFSDPTTDGIVEAAAPSTRAALVLSAVGADWRKGGL